jgi:hypothetical protein
LDDVAPEQLDFLLIILAKIENYADMFLREE